MDNNLVHFIAGVVSFGAWYFITHLSDKPTLEDYNRIKDEQYSKLNRIFNIRLKKYKNATKDFGTMSNYNLNIIHIDEVDGFNDVVQSIADIITSYNQEKIHHATVRLKNIPEEFIELLYHQFIDGNYEVKVLRTNNSQDEYVYFDFDWDKALKKRR